MGAASIVLVGVAINILQINKTVIVTHPVHVVYLINGPHPVHIEPRKPMLYVELPANTDVTIAAVMQATSTLTSLSCSTAIHAPEEHPGVGVIFQ